jgi:hypothetical protein
MRTAGHGRKVRGRPAARQLPLGCPYCDETFRTRQGGRYVVGAAPRSESRMWWPCELDPDRVGFPEGPCGRMASGFDGRDTVAPAP